ncbi:MAG: ABC transporter permease, partial [Dehalococcoidia bacterium]
VAVINLRSRQFEVEALFTGVDPARAVEFESLKDLQGNPVDPAFLGPNEAYIDREGAKEIDAQAGDIIGVALGPEALEQMTVKAVVDGWYAKESNTKLVLMVPLSRAQELLDKEGLLTFMLISNHGDAFSGEALTPRIMERFGELPALRDAGLEVFDVKREVVEEANEIGSLFVSFFTTFGLFSIGVGLLLIFLIFSMLAAERKSEMGMSRAVGMQRRHLVRLFMAEGAIYSLGSAIVGAIIGIGLGYILVIVTADIFAEDPTEDFNLSAHVEASSVLVSFLIGSVITFATVIFASRRISRLNIVRAIRDIPEPQLARAGRRTLFWGTVIAVLGVLVLFWGLRSTNLTLFGLGVSLVPVGVALILRWKGVAQRWVLSGTGLILLAYWLLPPSVYNRIREDWNQDFSIFFVAGALVVTGAVLVTVNNSFAVLRMVTVSLGRVRRIAPIIKSAVSYPLRFGFRTGLSLAMFAVVIFSITVMATVIEGFDRLFDDQERLAGGYDVIAFAQSDLNPIADLAEAVESNPDLAFVSRPDGIPPVGTFRTIPQADARISEDPEEEFADTFLTGVDDDFVASNRFQIKLATAEYAKGSGFDSQRVWRDLRDKPGLAVVNAFLVPTRNTFGFQPSSEDFALDAVEGLYLENDTMEPIEVTVRDLDSGTTFELTVIAVLDDFASGGPMPFGIFTSTNTLKAELSRDVNATQFFLNVAEETEDPATRIEAAFFQHGLETLDVRKTIEDFQEGQRAFFNLLIGFMTLGLVVGIAALGVISARAVVERRHEIGVMRAIGFSRRTVQLSFLAESSFIALLGIGLGLALGLLTSINVVADIRTDEPNIKLLIPWSTILIIALGGYLFSLLTTYLPARQAARITPAEALRYE